MSFWKRPAFKSVSNLACSLQDKLEKRYIFVFLCEKGLPGGMGIFLAKLIDEYSRHWTHTFSSPDQHSIFLRELKGTGAKVAIKPWFLWLNEL